MPQDPLPDNLGSLNKPDLVKLCEARKIDPDGTVPELIERLKASEPNVDLVNCRNQTGHGLTVHEGAPVAPGDTCWANPDNPHDAALINDGSLLPLDDQTPDPEDDQAKEV